MVSTANTLPTVPRLPRRSLTGRTLNILGDTMKVLLSSDDTRGQMTVLAMENAQGSASPVHFHEDESELLYVLAGVYEVEVDGVARYVVPGEFAWLPAGVPHAWRVVQGPARSFGVCTPGGIERLFAEIDALGARAQDDPATLIRTLAKHGLNVVPPPATR